MRAVRPCLLAMLVATSAAAENRLAMETLFEGGGTPSQIEVRGLEADVLQSGALVTFDLSDLAHPRAINRIPLKLGAFAFARNGSMIGVASAAGLELIRNGAYDYHVPLTGTMVAIHPYRQGFVYVVNEGFGATPVYFDPETQGGVAIASNLYVWGTSGEYLYAGVSDSLGVYRYDIEGLMLERVGDFPLPSGMSPAIWSAARRGNRLHAVSMGGQDILSWDVSSPAAPVALAVSPLPADIAISQSSPLAISEDGTSLTFGASTLDASRFSIRQMDVSTLPGTMVPGGIDLGEDGTSTVVAGGSQRIVFSQGYYPKYVRFADAASSAVSGARETCTIVQPVSGISGNFLYSQGTLGAVDISEPSNPRLRDVEPLDYNPELITGHTVTGGDGIRAISLDQSQPGDAVLKVWVSRDRMDPIAETTMTVDRSVSGGPIFDSFSNGRAFLSLYPADGVQPYQLRLVDVRTPGVPRSGLLPVPGGADSTTSFPAAASDERAFVVAKGAIHCFDISDPENPSHLGQFTPENFETVRLYGAHGDRVYATFRTSGSLMPRAVDFSNPAAPSIAATYPATLQTNTLSLGTFQYPLWALAQSAGGGTAVDIFDVTLPSASQPIYTSAAAQDTNTPTSFWFHGGLLVETFRLGSLRIRRLYRSELQVATAEQLLGVAPGVAQNDANADGVVCAGDIAFESQ